MLDEADENSKASTEQSLANTLEQTYHSYEAEFDILEQLERHGDLNDPAYLRSELKRNSFILAAQKMDQSRVEQNLEKMKQKHRRLSEKLAAT